MKKLIILTLLLLGYTGVKSQIKNSLVIYSDSGSTIINENIYGHFAEHLGHCVYGGIWVGKDSPIPNTRGMRNDIIEALKEIDVPVIRWPGGCFADAYHWKDGIGPQENRKGVINKIWGGELEDNSFGTHEFLDFCELINAEPYLAINVGSGTVEEASEWVDYVTSDIGPMADLRRENGRDQPWDVKYWGIGNESWGCGGYMNANYYANQFKKFSTFCTADYKIMSGGSSPNEYDWTETLMKSVENTPHLAQGYSFHNYTICNDWTIKGDATNFSEEEWFSTLSKTLLVDEYLTKQTEIMDKYDPEGNIGLIADEWGNWFDVEPGSNGAFLYQQNTLRDALTAGLYLNMFNNHADRVQMANLAQTVNVLQAVLLTKDNLLVKTPTFYVMKMYKVHQNATLLPFILQTTDYVLQADSIPTLNVSVSKTSEGIVHISIVNLDPKQEQSLSIVLANESIKKVSGEIIHADKMNAFNEFGETEMVSLKAFNNYTIKKDVITTVLPSKSVVTLTIQE